MMEDKSTEELCGEVLSRLVKAMGASGEARSHFRNSRIEFLKGVRQLVDDQIRQANRGEETKARKIEVE